jgi:ribosomal protein S6
VNRYEGLFILDLTGKEEGFNEAVEKVKTVITDAGAKVETIQKMDKKPYARITDKTHPAGYYVNVIFEITPSGLGSLKKKFDQVPEVYRVLFSHAAPPVPVAMPAAAAAN